MCFEPISLISAGIGVAMSVAQASAQSQQADAEYEAAQRRYEANRQQALAAQRLEQAQLGSRQAQEATAAAQQKRVQLLQGAQQQGAASAAAATSGVTGLSTDSIIADVGRQVDDNLATINTNARYTAAQLQSQKEAGALETKSRINSVPIPTKPDKTGAVLSAIGGGLDAVKGLRASSFVGLSM